MITPAELQLPLPAALAISADADGKRVKEQAIKKPDHVPRGTCTWTGDYKMATSDLWNMPCVVWKTQIPVENTPCNSPKFSLMGSDWTLWFTYQREESEEGGTYTVFLLRGSDNERNTKILLTNTTKERLGDTFNVTTFVQDSGQDSGPLLSRFKTVEYTKDDIWTGDSSDIFEGIPDFREYIELRIVCLFYTAPASQHELNNETVCSSCRNSLDYGSSVNDLPYLEILSLDLRNLLEDEALTDVKLKCGDRTFPAHRAILAARSEYFAGMFRTGMSESETGEVDIKDLEPNILEMVLRYVYSGKIPDLCRDDAIRLYAAAEFCGIQNLKDACSQSMVEHLNRENCLDLLVLADEHSDEQLKGQVVDFVAGQLHLLSSESWSAFREEHPQHALVVYDKHLADVLSRQPSNQSM